MMIIFRIEFELAKFVFIESTSEIKSGSMYRLIIIILFSLVHGIIFNKRNLIIINNKRYLIKKNRIEVKSCVYKKLQDFTGV